MVTHEHNGWRFFTSPTEADGAAAHLWCWARLDEAGRVMKSSTGFYTIISAMRDARSHGFDGPIEVGDTDFLLEQFGDRRAFLICTS
jgi:hypothetical protein